MSLTVAKGNLPISSIVTFYVDDALTCYFVIQRKSFKANFLTVNDRLSFSIWKLDEMLVQADAKVYMMPYGEDTPYFEKIKRY